MLGRKLVVLIVHLLGKELIAPLNNKAAPSIVEQKPQTPYWRTKRFFVAPEIILSRPLPALPSYASISHHESKCATPSDVGNYPNNIIFVQKQIEISQDISIVCDRRRNLSKSNKGPIYC